MVVFHTRVALVATLGAAVGAAGLSLPPAKAAVCIAYALMVATTLAAWWWVRRSALVILALFPDTAKRMWWFKTPDVSAGHRSAWADHISLEQVMGPAERIVQDLCGAVVAEARTASAAAVGASHQEHGTPTPPTQILAELSLMRHTVETTCTSMRNRWNDVSTLERVRCVLGDDDDDDDDADGDRSDGKHALPQRVEGLCTRVQVLHGDVDAFVLESKHVERELHVLHDRVCQCVKDAAVACHDDSAQSAKKGIVCEDLQQRRVDIEALIDILRSSYQKLMEKLNEVTPVLEETEDDLWAAVETVREGAGPVVPLTLPSLDGLSVAKQYPSLSGDAVVSPRVDALLKEIESLQVVNTTLKGAHAEEVAALESVHYKQMRAFTASCVRAFSGLVVSAEQDTSGKHRKIRSVPVFAVDQLPNMGDDGRECIKEVQKSVNDLFGRIRELHDTAAAASLTSSASDLEMTTQLTEHLTTIGTLEQELKDVRSGVEAGNERVEKERQRLEQQIKVLQTDIEQRDRVSLDAEQALQDQVQQLVSSVSRLEEELAGARTSYKDEVALRGTAAKQYETEMSDLSDKVASAERAVAAEQATIEVLKQQLTNAEGDVERWKVRVEEVEGMRQMCGVVMGAVDDLLLQSTRLLNREAPGVLASVLQAANDRSELQESVRETLPDLASIDVPAAYIRSLESLATFIADSTCVARSLTANAERVTKLKQHVRSQAEAFSLERDRIGRDLQTFEMVCEGAQIIVSDLIASVGVALDEVNAMQTTVHDSDVAVASVRDALTGRLAVLNDVVDEQKRLYDGRMQVLAKGQLMLKTAKEYEQERHSNAVHALKERVHTLTSQHNATSRLVDEVTEERQQLESVVESLRRECAEAVGVCCCPRRRDRHEEATIG